MLAARRYLREETAEAHKRVDDVFDRFDLTQATTYTTFLAAHHTALATIAAQAPAGIRVNIPHLLDLLSADLKVIGRMVPQPRLAVPCCPGHPIGVDYVLAGSHFGALMLRQRHGKMRDPVLRAADAYLRSDMLKAHWPDVQATLERLDRREHQRALSAALWTFDVFQKAGVRVLADAGSLAS